MSEEISLKDNTLIIRSYIFTPKFIKQNKIKQYDNTSAGKSEPLDIFFLFTQNTKICVDEGCRVISHY